MYGIYNIYIYNIYCLFVCMYVSHTFLSNLVCKFWNTLDFGSLVKVFLANEVSLKYQ